MNAGLLLYLSYGGGRAPHLVHLYPTLVDQEAAELFRAQGSTLPWERKVAEMLSINRG